MSKLDSVTANNPYKPKFKSRIPEGMKPPQGFKQVDADKLSVPKAQDYSVSLSTKSKELEKNLKQKMEVNTPEVNAPAEIDLPDINPEQEVAKEMAKEAVKEVAKVTEKKYWTKEQPAIVFISGFDWLGASSVKGSYDGIPEMGKAIEHAKHFTWDQEEEILEHIKEHQINQPLIIVGHSFGGDTAMEIANVLNTAENKFRTVDLIVTLDSVGTNNDEVPENVRINFNYMADDSWAFLNDGPNVAKDYQQTFVQNFLRRDGHTQLDDAPDIQKTILNAIKELT